MAQILIVWKLRNVQHLYDIINANVIYIAIVLVKLCSVIYIDCSKSKQNIELTGGLSEFTTFRLCRDCYIANCTKSNENLNEIIINSSK